MAKTEEKLATKTEEKARNWFREHADTIVILGSFALCFWTLNEKINNGFSKMDKDIAIIKTVLIMKNIMPSEMAVKGEK